jgi:hypothetical protein
MEQYNDRYIWVLRFREILFLIAEIGENMGAPIPNHVCLGDIRWYSANWGEHDARCCIALNSDSFIFIVPDINGFPKFSCILQDPIKTREVITCF